MQALEDFVDGNTQILVCCSIVMFCKCKKAKSRNQQLLSLTRPVTRGNGYRGFVSSSEGH